MYISTWVSLSLKTVYMLTSASFPRHKLTILSLLFLGQDSCHLSYLYNPAIWSRDAASYAVLNNIATNSELALCKGAPL